MPAGVESVKLLTAYIYTLQREASAHAAADADGTAMQVFTVLRVLQNGPRWLSVVFRHVTLCTIVEWTTAPDTTRP